METRKQLIERYSQDTCNCCHNFGRRGMSLVQAEQDIEQERTHKKPSIISVILKALEICYGEEKE